MLTVNHPWFKNEVLPAVKAIVDNMTGFDGCYFCDEIEARWAMIQQHIEDVNVDEFWEKWDTYEAIYEAAIQACYGVNPDEIYEASENEIDKDGNLIYNGEVIKHTYCEV